MKNIFKTQKIKEQPKKTLVVTSDVIKKEMDQELLFLLNDNSISILKDEVDSVENANKDILDKAKKLSELGFNNTPSVKVKQEIDKRVKDKKEAIELSKEEIELNAKYLLEFPGYKFVPDRIFENVREKYDLYTSNPDRYIKEIPEKNLEEVINFSNNIKDVWLISYWVFSINAINGSSTMSNATDGEEKFESEEEARDWMNKNKISDVNFFIHKEQSLEITAPISHFNLDKSEIKDRQISDVKDPIVSHKVKGGRIIVSVWDKEADIPEIKNEKLN